MRRRVVGVLMGVVVGAILGGWVGHASAGGQVLATVVGGSIGVVVGAVIVLLLPNDLRWSWTWRDTLELLGELLRSCLSGAVLVVASVITIGGFLLWNSLLLAAH